MAYQPLSLKARAIGLLAQREHSRSELRRKLLRILQQQQQKPRSQAAHATAPVSVKPSDTDAWPESDPGRATPPGVESRGRCRHHDLAEASPPDEPDDDSSPDGEALVDGLLDALAADGYLDESRFVESRLHVRAARFGAQRIQQELARHGLKLDASQQADLRSTELDRAREVWLRRFGAEPAREPQERARQMRFLLARGFAAEVVRRLLRAP